jgi:hypothetical protein
MHQCAMAANAVYDRKKPVTGKCNFHNRYMAFVRTCLGMTESVFCRTCSMHGGQTFVGSPVCMTHANSRQAIAGWIAEGYFAWNAVCMTGGYFLGRLFA